MSVAGALDLLWIIVGTAAMAAGVWERRRAARYWQIAATAHSEAAEMVLEAARAHDAARAAILEASSEVQAAQARQDHATRALALARDLTSACREFHVLHEYGAYDEALDVVTRAFEAIKEGTR